MIDRMMRSFISIVAWKQKRMTRKEFTYVNILTEKLESEMSSRQYLFIINKYLDIL